MHVIQICMHIQKKQHAGMYMVHNMISYQINIKIIHGININKNDIIHAIHMFVTKEAIR